MHNVVSSGSSNSFFLTDDFPASLVLQFSYTYQNIWESCGQDVSMLLNLGACQTVGAPQTATSCQPSSDLICSFKNHAFKNALQCTQEESENFIKFKSVCSLFLSKTTSHPIFSMLLWLPSN